MGAADAVDAPLADRLGKVVRVSAAADELCTSGDATESFEGSVKEFRLHGSSLVGERRAGPCGLASVEKPMLFCSVEISAPPVFRRSGHIGAAMS
jgi:hypothetical protein